jgi:GH25 family lysozyme M1 (1,4-beta-N-acetylmuramidase)
MKPIPRVMDLSHYDDVQDKFGGAVTFGIWGVINKVTEGVGCVDKSFQWRRGHAANAGLLYGGYHFLHPGRIEAQADWFLQNVGDTQGLLLAVDHEDENGRHASLGELKQWLTYVHSRVGRWPWLYSGNLIKEQLGSSRDPFWKQIKLWLAHYSAEPTWPPAFDEPPLIQFTGDGEGPPPHNVPGIEIAGKGIDLNHFSGSRDVLAALWSA